MPDPADAPAAHEPLRLPGWQAQYTAGGLAAWAAHLIGRRPEVHMDVSWLGALLTAVELCYCDALHCERPRPLVGPHPPTAYPSGAIGCADGYVCPGSLRRDDWEMQCLHIGVPEWIDDPELSHRHRRVRHIDKIREVIEPWYAARTKRDLFQFALDTPIEVVEHPITGARRHIASPFTLDGDRPAQAGPSPLFDQHTDEVMAEVARLKPEQLTDLRGGGHIGGELPPPAELGFVYD